MGEIIMPKMGDAMSEGKVVRWYKKAGDPVTKGEPLLEIETDKVNLDIEAEEDGVVGEIEVEEGTTVDVGTTLATIRAEGDAPAEPKKKESKEKEPKEKEPKEKKPAAKKQKPSDEEKEEPESAEYPEVPKPKPKPKPEPGAEAEEADEQPQEDEPPSPEKERVRREGETIRSSPLARRMAKELGVDIGSISGSGPAGRVIAADVEKASKGEAKKARPEPKPVSRPPAAAQRGGETRKLPLTAMRRTIASRLVESLGPIPHFFLTIDVDVTDLLALREQVNAIGEAKTSVNDFVVRAAALSLLDHPNVNSSFTAEAIIQHGEIHIGIAVATPEGLITPVVRHADGKSVREINDEVRTLAERARNRRLMPDDYQGSTFTISNLGMYGIEEFTAIINPPNVAILAVGAAQPRAVVSGREIVVRDRMKITMSCDHRVVDGAAGAEFLKTLRQYLEQPLRLVL
jgi:pyruvate dehydrogenase E2 component (dihydrolipoamide acetyltransferase)